jgi:hypothetical protein
MPASAPLTGTAGFPAGPSLARLNAVPKTQEIAKTLQTQAKSIRSWTCGRGSAKSLRPQDRLMRASSPHQARPAGKPALPGKAGAPRKNWDRRLSRRPVVGAAECRAQDAGNRESPSNPSGGGSGGGLAPLPPRPPQRWGRPPPPNPPRPAGKPALPGKAGAPRKNWDRRLSSRPVFGAAQCRAKDAGNRESPSNPS